MAFDAAAFSKAFRVRMISRKLSVRHAAKQIGISPSTVCRLCHEKVPDMATYMKVRQWIDQTEIDTNLRDSK